MIPAHSACSTKQLEASMQRLDTRYPLIQSYTQRYRPGLDWSQSWRKLGRSTMRRYVPLSRQIPLRPGLADEAGQPEQTTALTPPHLMRSMRPTGQATSSLWMTRRALPMLRAELNYIGCPRRAPEKRVAGGAL